MGKTNLTLWGALRVNLDKDAAMVTRPPFIRRVECSHPQPRFEGAGGEDKIQLPHSRLGPISRNPGRWERFLLP